MTAARRESGPATAAGTPPEDLIPDLARLHHHIAAWGPPLGTKNDSALRQETVDFATVFGLGDVSR